MKKIELTAFDLAQRFIGIEEVAGTMSNPQILAMSRLDSKWVAGDDVPWCSAFVNYVCWLLRLPRSKSLAARSWLGVGVPLTLVAAEPGYDVVILKRGDGIQPGPEVIAAPGHVGFFAGLEGPRGETVLLLGGNQGDMVNLSRFPVARVLGARRLYS